MFNKLKKERNRSISSVTQEKEFEKIRTLSGWQKNFGSIVAISMSLYTICSNSIILVPEIERNALYLSFMLTLIFMYYPFSNKLQNNKGVIPFYDWILIVLGASSGIYCAFRIGEFATTGCYANNVDYFFGAIAILLVLEASRRVLGYVIPALSIIFILYALFGSYMPGIFKFRGMLLTRFINRMYLSSEGLWGITTSVASTFLFIYILFSSFLETFGSIDAFNKIAYSIAGSKKGGPALVAVIASALMGSISGSATANVVTTGSFTIPLMKKMGYDPDFAAGVEAAASTGGLIMPPVMGTVAFLMVGFLGITYLRVISAAILPAFLYYASITIMVILQARKDNLEGIPSKDLPKLSETFKKRWNCIIPLLSIIAALLVGKTALYAGFVGIIAALISSYFIKETRPNFQMIISSLESAAKNATGVSIAAVCCGFIVGVATITGIGNVISLNIIKLSQGIPFLVILLIGVSSIFLSAALPASALYIVVSIVAVPALVNFGFSKLASHFFVLYLGVMSNLTPPIAVASIAAAGIAQSSVFKTALKGLKLAAAGLIIPIMAMYNPVILMENVTFLGYLQVSVTGLLGVFALAVSLQGYLRRNIAWILRIGFFISALLLIDPGGFTDSIGIILLTILIVFSYIGRANIFHQIKYFLNRDTLNRDTENKNI